MTSQGSPYTRFRRAIATGDLTIIRLAALEVPRVNLREALAILPLIAVQEPDRYERAACKWLARLALERDVGLEEVGIAVDALDRLATAPDIAATVLAELERSARPLPATGGLTG